MPRYDRNKTCLVKLETTYGVDATPTGAADALLCRDDIDISPIKNTKTDRKNIQPFFGGAASLVVGTNMEYTITCELQASGTLGTKPGSALDALLQIAGMAVTVSAGVSVTYNLISAGLPSATIYYNRAGTLYKLVGCRGSSIEIKLTPLGVPYITFKGLGLYGGVVDQALPSVTLTAYKTPAAVNNANTSAFSLASYSGILYDLSASITNQAKYRNAIGVEDIILTDRSGTGSVEIEEPTIAAKDYYSISRASTVVPLTITHGTAAGYKVKLDLNAQLTDPKPSNRDGVATVQMGLDLTTVNGNDELVLTFI